MLDAAGVRPGLRVLDVAAGTGDQSVLAAQRLRPTGSLLATDVSASMLSAAAETVRAAGLDNVTTQVADASTLELDAESFDAAICRFGLMFVPDLHQALTRVRHALKTGRQLSPPWSGRPKPTTPISGCKSSSCARWTACLRRCQRWP